VQADINAGKGEMLMARICKLSEVGPAESRFQAAIFACIILTIAALHGCASTSVTSKGAEQARGREQLIRAFDAAWIRVVASGRDQQILATEPANKPGLAAGYIVRMADCLPQPQFAVWPAKPLGLFKQILERGSIRRLVQAVPDTPQNTSYYFSGVSEKYLHAVLDEISQHYGVRLKLEDVALPPGPLPSTSALLDGRADFIDQLNATGGDTQGMRRRISRRFSCTMTASSQFIQIPAASPLAATIASFNDLVAHPEVRICAGPLATQTARAFLPKHSVTTKYVNDLSGCARDIEAGKADVMISPLPDLTIAGIAGYKSVHTLLVAGTPLWVAQEGIECLAPAANVTKASDRPAETACRELDPP
jgi:hypothetical protein